MFHSNLDAMMRITAESYGLGGHRFDGYRRYPAWGGEKIFEAIGKYLEQNSPRRLPLEKTRP